MKIFVYLNDIRNLLMDDWFGKFYMILKNRKMQYIKCNHRNDYKRNTLHFEGLLLRNQFA